MRGGTTKQSRHPADSAKHVIPEKAVRWRASMAAVYCINLFFIILPDSKRQQTTTVDYKRLINGFFLTRFTSLRHNSNSLDYDHEEKEIHGRHCIEKRNYDADARKRDSILPTE